VPRGQTSFCRRGGGRTSTATKPRTHGTSSRSSSTIVIGIFEDAGPPVQGELPGGDQIQKCWFAHPLAVHKLSDLVYAQKNDFRRHAPGHGPHEFDHVLVERTLQQIELSNCRAVCRKLDGKKSGDVTWWADREEWIRNDLSRRPIAMPKS
jgi:hypothetical protein